MSFCRCSLSSRFSPGDLLPRALAQTGLACERSSRWFLNAAVLMSASAVLYRAAILQPCSSHSTRTNFNCSNCQGTKPSVFGPLTRCTVLLVGALSPPRGPPDLPPNSRSSTPADHSWHTTRWLKGAETDPPVPRLCAVVPKDAAANAQQTRNRMSPEASSDWLPS